jgi:hypothetical protein
VLHGCSVGYSYCDGPDPVKSCPIWNDTAAAQDNHAFLQAIAASHPQRRIRRNTVGCIAR